MISTLQTLAAPCMPSGMSDYAEPARPPIPPFTAETALQKVKAAEAAWNSRYVGTLKALVGFMPIADLKADIPAYGSQGSR